MTFESVEIFEMATYLLYPDSVYSLHGSDQNPNTVEELEIVVALRHEKRLDNSRRLVRQADADYIYLQLNNASPQNTLVEAHVCLLLFERESSIKNSRKETGRLRSER